MRKIEDCDSVLRGAVFVSDGQHLVLVLLQYPWSDRLQLAGDSPPRFIAGRRTNFRAGTPVRLEELHVRGWEGDEDLAVHYAAALSERPVPMLPPSGGPGRAGRRRVLAETKSASSTRRFALSPALVDDLAAPLVRRGLTVSRGDALLFVNGDRTPLDYTNWHARTWVPACEKADLPGLRFHDLRSIATLGGP